MLQTVFIRSAECNVANIYKARHCILAVGSKTVCPSDQLLTAATSISEAAADAGHPLDSSPPMLHSPLTITPPSSAHGQMLGIVFNLALSVLLCCSLAD